MVLGTGESMVKMLAVSVSEELLNLWTSVFLM